MRRASIARCRSLLVRPRAWSSAAARPRIRPLISPGSESIAWVSEVGMPLALPPTNDHGSDKQPKWQVASIGTDRASRPGSSAKFAHAYKRRRSSSRTRRERSLRPEARPSGVPRPRRQVERARAGKAGQPQAPVRPVPVRRRIGGRGNSSNQSVSRPIRRSRGWERRHVMDVSWSMGPNEWPHGPSSFAP